MYLLGLSLLGFVAVVFIYLYFGTLFFFTIGWDEISGWKDFTSLFKPTASMWLSYAVIFVYFLEILHYISRFFTSSLWLRLIKDCLILIVLLFVINYPLEHILVDSLYIYLDTVFFILILFFTIVAALNFLQSLSGILYSGKYYRRQQL